MEAAGRREGEGGDRISVASVSLRVTRQMRRWLVPARNLSLVRCPPAETSGGLGENIPLGELGMILQLEGGSPEA